MQRKSVTGGLALLGGMAFVEGVPTGFATIALPIRLTAQGLSGAALGALLALPLAAFVAQPFLGALVDRLGPRRPVALFGHAALALTFAGLVVTEPPTTAATAFGTLLFALGAVAAVQQVAVDALAIDRARPEERGRVSGVLFGGRQLGTLLGGPALALWGVHEGWQSAYGVAALVCLLPLPFVARMREAPRAPGGMRLLPTMLAAVRAPGAPAVVAFALLAGSSSALLRPIVLPLFRDEASLSMDQLTALDSIGLLTSTLAALAGGVLSDRIGRRTMLVVAGVLTAAVHVVFAEARPYWSSFPALVAMTIAGDVANGFLQAGVLALLVDVTDPRVGATQLQIYFAAVRARTSVVTVIGGRLSAAAPFGMSIAVAVGLELAALGVLLFVGAAVRSAETTG